jgi:hypothetical protein
LPTKAICCRIFTPALPDYPAASVRDFCSGAYRQHSLPQIIGDLLQAEIAEKQARSIKYQVAIARLPLAKELSDFRF